VSIRVQNSHASQNEARGAHPASDSSDKRFGQERGLLRVNRNLDTIAKVFAIISGRERRSACGT
jgi:hypothetical protein